MEKHFEYSDLILALGKPAPPPEVTELQFDNEQEALERLAKSDETNVQFNDLEAYAFDLRYLGTKLQPDLFRYAFPLCLKGWSDYLKSGKEGGAFVERFHMALTATPFWRSFLKEEEREAVYRFMGDAILGAIERERGLRFKGHRDPAGVGFSAYRWMSYLASYGTLSPDLPRVWGEWWSVGTPGAAISALQYASCLIYPEMENPVFFRWTPNRGGGPPCLWHYESQGFEERWLPENVEFLWKTLSFPYLQVKLGEAVRQLEGAEEFAQGEAILRDLEGRQATVKERSAILPERFATPSRGPIEW
jgi:hypothetical protein